MLLGLVLGGKAKRKSLRYRKMLKVMAAYHDLVVLMHAFNFSILLI